MARVSQNVADDQPGYEQGEMQQDNEKPEKGCSQRATEAARFLREYLRILYGDRDNYLPYRHGLKINTVKRLPKALLK